MKRTGDSGRALEWLCQKPAECEMMDPKQVLMKRTGDSGRALEWLRQKLILMPVVEVRKSGAQTSYRRLKAGRAGFGGLHGPKVKIQSLK